MTAHGNMKQRSSPCIVDLEQAIESGTTMAVSGKHGNVTTMFSLWVENGIVTNVGQNKLLIVMAEQ